MLTNRFLFKNIFRKGIARSLSLLLLMCIGHAEYKGQAATGLDFDGVDDYVDLTNSSYLKGSGSQITVELWVYMSTWSNGKSIISNVSNGTTVYGGYEISTASGNLNAYLHRNNSFGVVSTALGSISSGWHHIAMTFDGRYLKLYVDAVLKGTDDALSNYSIGFNSNNTYLGKGDLSAGGGSSGYFLGKMDQLRIFYSSRTQCQISNYMNLEGAPNEPDAPNYWDCLEDYQFNSGYVNVNNAGLTMLTNSSPYGSYSGTLYNFALTGTTSNWAAGIVTTGSVGLLTINQNTTPCVYGSTTLTASGAVSYTWGTGPAGASLAIPSVSVGVGYTVYATRSNGCVYGQRAIYPNYHSPSISISASDDVICSGTTVTLTASGASSYTWSTGLQNAVYTATPSNNITRTVTGTDAFGCSSGPYASAVITITVNPSPTVNISPSSTVICSNNNVTLTANGASTYLWSNNSTTLSTANPFVTGPNANFTRTVTGTAANGCTDIAVQTISVNTAPTLTITSTSTVTCAGDAVTLTASGANTYTWTGGPTSAAYSPGPLATTIYTVTGTTSASGCTDTAVQSISVITTPTVTISASPGTVICSGTQATLTANGTGSFVWSNGGSTNSSISISPASTVNRTVTITAANGCTNDAVQTISVNASPVLTITPASTVICSGKTTTLTASGANTYTWTSGPSTSAYTVSPGSTTSYTVTGTTSASGCTDTAVQSVSVNASPTINIAATSTVICSGKSATLTASNASTYTWTSGPATAGYTVSPAATTIYTVTGTSAVGGCTDNAVQSISVNASPTINIAATSTVICSGKTATLTASNANTYTWTSGPATSVYAVSPVVTTIYTVTGTSATGGCTDNAVQSISVNASPTINIVATSTVICTGQTTTLTANNANTYTWTSGPATTVYAVSPLATSIYTVTGTSAVGGCTDNAVQSISVNASPTINIAASSTVICSGKTATLTANNAYTYTWTSGPATAAYTVSPAATTNYTVTGTSATGGCTDIAVQSISVNASPTINIAATSTVICSGQTTTLTANNANTYTWTSGPATTVYAVSPAATTIYTVTGTSAVGGCTDNAVQSISVNASPTINIAATSTVICSGKTATLTASNANTYTWTSGPATAAYTVSPAATTVFTVTGTSATGGCTNSAVQSISVNASPTINIAATSTVICTGQTTTLTANNANTYTWTSGPATTVYAVSPIATTIYTVTGTSATGGCTNSAVQSISVNASPTINIAATSTVICTGQTTTLTATNANTYTWTSGPATTVYAVSPAITTIYTVTGTSATGGCTNSAVQSISVNASPTINIAATNTVICSGQTTTLTANNANTYTWTSGPATTVYAVSPTANTIYTVIGTSATGGCTNSAVQTISVNTTPTVSIAATSTVICSGKTATLTASNANTYTWTSGPATTVYAVSPAVTTIYTVTGTSANGGCTNSAVQSISVNASPTINIAATNTVICSGQTTTLTASNANTYTWTSGPATTVYAVSPAANTIYTVTGTSATGGCTNSAVQSISVNATPTINITSTGSVICSGQTTTLTANNANTYTWTSGPATTVYAVSPVTNTNYTVTGTSASGGCTNFAVQSISVNPSPTINIAATSTVICSGKSTTLTANNANTYTWTSGPSTTVYAVSPAATTIFTVTGTSASGGCTNTAVQTISVNASPTINISATNTVICSGQTTTLTASNANTYTWTSGPATTVYAVSPLTTTIYTVTGTSATGGCTNSAAQTISVNASPTINIAASSTVICAGESATLAAGNANTYTWTSGPATTVYAVSPVATTIYTVTGTSATGGCTNSAVQSISVNAVPIVSIVPSSTTVCAGGTLTLTATGASNYNWTGGPLTATQIISPLTSSNYTVTGTSAVTGCSNTAVQSISVLPVPVLTITPSSTVICEGQTASLTASGANTYSWMNISNGTVITVAPSTTNNYTLIGFSPASCSSTAVQQILVNPNPNISVSGSTFICAGTPVVLTASGALTYTWNGNTGGNTISVTPTTTTTYSIAGTNSLNCSKTATYQVITPAMLTPTLCLVTVDSVSLYNQIYWEKAAYPRADTFLVLRETSASFYSVIARISKDSLGMYVDTNRSVGLFNGNPNFTSYRYKIQYRDSCGNLSAMSPYHQTIKVQDNQTGNFNWNYYTKEDTGPMTTLNYILWRENVITGVKTMVGGTGTTAFTDPSYSALALAGNVKWYVTTTGFDCDPSLRHGAGKVATTKSNSTNERQFPVETGIRSTLLTQINYKLYPNPVENKLRLDFDHSITNVTIEISDLSGRIVETRNVHENNSVLDMSQFENGIYFLRIIAGGSSSGTNKIIVQH